MNIIIRKSIPTDVYGIREIQKITWLATYPNKKEDITTKDIMNKFKIDNTPEGKKKLEQRKKNYKNNRFSAWVAERQNKIIAFCIASKETDNNRIGSIYVLPNYQRMGIGKRLIKKAFTWFGKEKNILVNTARYNKKAILFYKKHGFILTGKKGNLDTAAMLPSGKYILEIELVKIF